MNFEEVKRELLNMAWDQALMEGFVKGHSYMWTVRKFLLDKKLPYDNKSVLKNVETLIELGIIRLSRERYFGSNIGYIFATFAPGVLESIASVGVAKTDLSKFVWLDKPLHIKNPNKVMKRGVKKQHLEMKLTASAASNFNDKRVRARGGR